LTVEVEELDQSSSSEHFNAFMSEGYCNFWIS
jgi:hypothetical protein